MMLPSVRFAIVLVFFLHAILAVYGTICPLCVAKEEDQSKHDLCAANNFKQEPECTRDTTGCECAHSSRYHVMRSLEVFQRETVSKEFVKHLEKETLPIEVQMKYTTDIAASLLSVLFEERFTTAFADARFNDLSFFVLGVGSFGRHELLPCSDLDVLVVVLGPDILVPKTYNRLKREKSKKPAFVKTDDVVEILKTMNDEMKAELERRSGGIFIDGAFGLDPAVARIHGDSEEKLMLQFTVIEGKATAVHGGNMGAVSMVADATVLFERVSTVAEPRHHHWRHIQREFILSIDPNTIQIMLRADLIRNYYAHKGKGKSHELDYAKKHGFDAKLIFVRPFTIFTYWAYLAAYTLPGSGRRFTHPFVSGTVERMHQLAEWGHLDPLVATWASIHFHKACGWMLKSNFKPRSKSTTATYSHGAAFPAGSKKQIRKMLESLDILEPFVDNIEGFSRHYLPRKPVMAARRASLSESFTEEEMSAIDRGFAVVRGRRSSLDEKQLEEAWAGLVDGESEVDVATASGVETPDMAHKEYYNDYSLALLANYEYDVALEEAREKRAIQKLYAEKKAIQRADRQTKPRLIHIY